MIDAFDATLSRTRSGASRYAVIVPLAIAMGIQNATARRLAVADLTTTVLTPDSDRYRSRWGDRRRTGSKGRSSTALSRRDVAWCPDRGVLVLQVDNAAPLALATALLAIVSFSTYRAARSSPAWANA